MKRKTKIQEFEQEILDGLTEEQKRKYFIRAWLIFSPIYLSLFVIGLWMSCWYVYDLIYGNRTDRYQSCGLVLVVVMPYYIVKFIRRPRDQKVLDYYRLINVSGIVQNNRGLLWFGEISLILFTICLPLYSLISGTSVVVVLDILFLLSGIILSSFFWYVALRKRKNVSEQTGDNKKINDKNKDVK